jgi:hypothetical protein
MKIDEQKSLGWKAYELLVVIFLVGALWLVTLPTNADDHVLGFKGADDNYGWMYNSESQVLSFCTDYSENDEHSADAEHEIICMPFPKRVDLVREDAEPNESY